MTSRYGQHMTPTTPSETEALLAQKTSKQLTALLDKESAYQIQLLHNGQPGEVLAVPAPAMRLLAQILSEMAQGNAVALTPIYAELSTQQAADLMNVSRPYLIEMLDKGEIPYRKVGVHRRVLFADVMAYKRTLYNKRLQALNELTSYDQELGLQ
jgi:excisionase family DNA binding protein